MSILSWTRPSLALCPTRYPLSSRSTYPPSTPQLRKFLAVIPRASYLQLDLDSFPVVDSLPKRTMQEALEMHKAADPNAGVSQNDAGSNEIPESCFYDRNDPANDPDLFWKPWGAPCTHDLYQIPYKNMTEPIEGTSLWFSGFYHEFANTRRTSVSTVFSRLSPNDPR